MDDIFNSISESIAKYRKNKGITQRELSIKIDYNPNYICRIENRQDNISLTALVKISEVLEIPIKRFLPDNEEINYYEQRYLNLNNDQKSVIDQLYQLFDS